MAANSSSSLPIPKAKQSNSRRTTQKRRSTAVNGTTQQPISMANAEAEIRRFLSEDEILEVALRFAQLRQPVGAGIAVADASLAEPEDLTFYGTTTEIQTKLWKLEIYRLVAAVRHESESLTFDGGGIFNKIADEEGFFALHHIARQIHEAFYICTHDFDLFMLEHAPEFSEDVMKSLVRVHRVLNIRRRINETPQDNKTGSVDWFNGREREAYFLLVNYITATLARFLVRCAMGRTWTQECIALLAKWAAKLKYISGDPIGSVEKTLNKATAFRQRKAMEFQEEVLSALYGSGDLSLDSKKQSDLVGALDDAMQSEKGDRTIRARATKALMYHEYLASNFFYLLSDLQCGRSGSDCFQVARVVYKSGLDDWMTLLGSDRESLMAASSSLACLRYAYVAFNMFVNTATKISEGQKAVDKNHAPDSAGHEIKVAWSLIPRKQTAVKSQSQMSSIAHDQNAVKAGLAGASGLIHISTMEDAISVLVPLCLSDPAELSNFATLLYIANLVSDFDPPDQFPNEMFTAMVHITTDEFDKRFPKGSDQDVKRVPTVPLWDPVQPHRQSQKKGVLSSIPLPMFRDEHLRESKEDLEFAEKRMETWTYDENSIAVPCLLYVASVLSSAVVLVAGGLAVGFTVNDRIKGVDPFNITLFFWILAGFIVAVFKSFRVENWPWRDFIFCRVVCRSVSELHAVTRVSEQLILRRLLQKERVNILKTRGPFNAAFLQKSDSVDGFSIDRPLTLKSMMLSGLIMIKVKTPEGYALICLDVKRGSHHDGVGVYSSGDEERLVCMDPSPAAKGSHGEFKLTRRKLGWVQTVGLYSVMDSKFG